jgi:hypothetical protein
LNCSDKKSEFKNSPHHDQAPESAAAMKAQVFMALELDPTP